MIKGMILLADGFEQTEALQAHDAFRRTGKIQPVLVSIHDRKEVESSSGVKVIADGLLSENKGEGYAFLMLPGGKRGVENLKHSPEVISLIKAFRAEGKPVYAICAAPSILGELGYLDGKNYTCFPGFQTGKGHYIDQGAVVDGDLITGHSMGYTLAFAEAIIKKLLGEEAVLAIHPGTMGLS